ncbi:GGDEF domain-containing protein [Deinococcus aerophilus]|nr:GGDEF domain-containing protein [Deinococcus aerophilus]
MRRRIYLGIAGGGMIVQVVVWVLNLQRAYPDVVTLYSNPVFFAMSSWNLFWLYTRRPIETVYAVALAVCGAVIVARAVVTPLQGGPALLTSLEDLYWLLVIVSIVSFLMLNYRRAIAVTAGFYLLGVALPWAVMALNNVDFFQAARLAQIQLLCGMVLATLWSLAWYREHFVLERQALLMTERLANTDALTGLNNRHALYPLLDQKHDRGGALLLLDIDHFKAVNDRLGHSAGDEVLRRVAATLRRSLRDAELLGRWGGEEFLVMLPGVRPQEALQRAEHLRRAVAAQTDPPEQAVTISVGIGLIGAGEGMSAGMSRADDALYTAKQQGRNRVWVSEPARSAPQPARRRGADQERSASGS